MESKETQMSRQEELLEYIRDAWPDSLLADGYNDAIIGVSSGFDSGRIVYSVSKMIEICMQALATDYEEALEWLEYNTFGAFVGEYTPIYVDDLYKEMLS